MNMLYTELRILKCSNLKKCQFTDALILKLFSKLSAKIVDF